MKLPVIIAAFAVSLGLSFAAGGYFAPAFLRGGSSTASWAPSPAAQAAGNTAPGTPSNSGGVASQASTATSGDLPAILKETNSYRLLKDLTAYAESIPAADMPKAVENVQSLSRNGNQYQALGILVGRWVELDPKAALAATQKNQNHG